MTLSIGQSAPNIRLTTLDGQPVPLAQAWQAGRPALLIFLRHLG